MAGFWHLSHHQMRDPNGRVFAGAKAFFYAADTLLPLTVYQDYGLGTAHPNPVEANAYGIFPPVFLDEDDGFYRQRITSSGGVIIPGSDVGVLPIIGPAGGGGGSEVPVDPNSLFKTGDTQWLDVTGSRPGWVRDNGRSIGNAVSGASERANADCEALYAWLWQNFSNSICPVTGGRGASAAADWAAGKPIATRDRRGRAAFGLDDMGNAAAGVITGGTTAGSSGGEQAHTLTGAEVGPHTHTGTTESAGEHIHGMSSYAATGTAGFVGPGGGGGGTFTTNTAGAHTHSFTTAENIGGEPHNNMPPYDLGTWYRKL